jgi:hypothetical protein
MQLQRIWQRQLREHSQVLRVLSRVARLVLREALTTRELTSSNHLLDKIEIRPQNIAFLWTDCRFYTGCP